jgi:hypothetical protein
MVGGNADPDDHVPPAGAGAKRMAKHIIEDTAAAAAPVSAVKDKEDKDSGTRTPPAKRAAAPPAADAAAAAVGSPIELAVCEWEGCSDTFSTHEEVRRPARCALALCGADDAVWHSCGST